MVDSDGLLIRYSEISIVGSNPAPTAILWGDSSEGRAVPLHGTGRRFDPGSLHYYWDIAQLVERLAVNQNVAGSIPAIPAFADVAQMAEQ